MALLKKFKKVGRVAKKAYAMEKAIRQNPLVKKAMMSNPYTAAAYTAASGLDKLVDKSGVMESHAKPSQVQQIGSPSYNIATADASGNRVAVKMDDLLDNNNHFAIDPEDVQPVTEVRHNEPQSSSVGLGSILSWLF